MYLSSSSRTFTSRCSFKYSQIRRRSIFKGILSFTTTNPSSNFSSSNHFQVLPNDPSARRLFVTSGGLKKIQELKPEPGSALKEHINNINACFPEEIVRYYTPGYSEQLLQRVDTYKPSDHTGTSFMNIHYSSSILWAVYVERIYERLKRTKYDWRNELWNGWEYRLFWTWLRIN